MFDAAGTIGSPAIGDILDFSKANGKNFNKNAFDSLKWEAKTFSIWHVIYITDQNVL